MIDRQLPSVKHLHATVGKIKPGRVGTIRTATHGKLSLSSPLLLILHTLLPFIGVLYLIFRLSKCAQQCGDSSNRRVGPGACSLFQSCFQCWNTVRWSKKGRRFSTICKVAKGKKKKNSEMTCCMLCR